MEGKDKILIVAAKIFADKGLSKTKISDIATEAGVSKKTIYKFFDSKEDLIMKVYGSLIMKVNLQVENLVNSENSISKKLAGIIEISINNLGQITPTLISDAKGTVPKVKEFLDQYIENAVFKRFRTLISHGLEAGSIKKDVDIDSVILLYRDAILSFLYMRFNRNVPGNVNARSPLNVFCEALTTIFRGILSNEAVKEFDILISDIKY